MSICLNRGQVRGVASRAGRLTPLRTPQAQLIGIRKSSSTPCAKRNRLIPRMMSHSSIASLPQYSSGSDKHSSGTASNEKASVAANIQQSLRSLTPIERPSEAPLSDLEVRLDTTRAIDLFTMRPKVSSLDRVLVIVITYRVS
jgi:hypothetical protein